MLTCYFDYLEGVFCREFLLPPQEGTVDEVRASAAVAHACTEAGRPSKGVALSHPLRIDRSLARLALLAGRPNRLEIPSPDTT